MTLTFRKYIEEGIEILPELSKFKGKNVIIKITEEKKEIKRETGLKKFFDLAGKIDIDEEAIKKLREKSKI